MGLYVCRQLLLVYADSIELDGLDAGTLILFLTGFDAKDEH